jgi:tripartite-type tricarboxylate transporter receptor subunit TctC
LLLGNSSTHTIGPSLNARLPYDAQKDFAPVAYLADSAAVLVVSPATAVGSLAELVQLARNRPGQLNYATAGTGSSAHLQAELFRSQTGTAIVHIPYKGTGPALTDLLGGYVQMMFADIAVALPQLRAGKLRALAVSGVSRAPQLPEVPTLAEAGYPGASGNTWMGLYAPAGTPSAIIARLNLLVYQALQDGELSARLLDMALTPGRQAAPEQLANIQRTDTDKWRRVIQSAGIRLD